MGTGSRAKFASSSSPGAQKQVSLLTFSPAVTLGGTAALWVWHPVPQPWRALAPGVARG